MQLHVNRGDGWQATTTMRRVTVPLVRRCQSAATYDTDLDSDAGHDTAAAATTASAAPIRYDDIVGCVCDTNKLLQYWQPETAQLLYPFGRR